ncbi:MAG: ATP-grasp domain-containing protein [Patescibacteria group bacterium]
MKIVAIYFDKKEKMGYPFNNPNYYETYKCLNEHCRNQGIELRFPRGKEAYLGSMRFSSYWQFTDDDIVYVDMPFTADLIYVKGLEIETTEEDTVINQKRLQQICRDKLLTYQTFPDYVIPTYHISKSTAPSVLNKIDTETVVVKPIDGIEGNDVQITKKESFDSESLTTEEDVTYIAQPFIDSSSGVPGLTETYHDLRLFIFNGEIKKSYIRIPKEGSLMANIALGAKAILLPPEQVPPSAQKLVSHVEEVFHVFTPRIYTLDIMYQDEKPFIVELNDQPGIPYVNFGDYTIEYYHHLIDVFNSV